MEKTINKIYNLVLKYKGCTLNDEECKLFQELQNELENYKILKDFINNFIQFQLVYDDIDHYEIIPVKQYIGNSGCLLLTEEKMKKLLEVLEKK